MGNANILLERRGPAQDERRREQRIGIGFPVQVLGIDTREHFFAELAQTLNVSECGCEFAVKSEVQAGAVVAMRLIGRGLDEGSAAHHLLYEVRWVKPVGEFKHAGARRLQPGNLWNEASANLASARVMQK